MTSRLLISLSLLLLAGQAACAQSAAEFFHAGAQSYLTNNLALAREEVDKGLKLFPDDIQLKKLDELLKQQQQQQSKNDQQKQEQDKKDQQQKQQQEQKEKDQPKQDQKDQKDQEKPEQPEKSSGEKKDKADKPEPDKSSQPMQAHAMTPQEAKQLLDAQKGDEQVLQFKPPGKPENRGRALKDW